MEGIMGYGQEYLRNKHRQTLIQIFIKPVPSGVKWQDIERLVLALGERSTPAAVHVYASSLTAASPIFIVPILLLRPIKGP
jgi:hypothetical protein